MHGRNCRCAAAPALRRRGCCIVGLPGGAVVRVRLPGGSPSAAASAIAQLRLQRDRIERERLKMLAARAGTAVLLGPIGLILGLDPGEFSTRAAAAESVVSTLDAALLRCEALVEQGDVEGARTLALRLVAAVSDVRPWDGLIVDVDRLGADIARDAKIAVGVGVGVVGAVAAAWVAFQLFGRGGRR